MPGGPASDNRGAVPGRGRPAETRRPRIGNLIAGPAGVAAFAFFRFFLPRPEQRIKDQRFRARGFALPAHDLLVVVVSERRDVAASAARREGLRRIK